MANFSIFSCVLGFMLLAQSTAAQLLGHNTVPDVLGAFNNLSDSFEPILANRIGSNGMTGMTGPICKHYQGIARYNDPDDGTPYLYISRSGNTTDSCPIFTDDEPGALEVIRLGSRPTDGERLGSNLDQRDIAQFDTPIPQQDEIVNSLRFTGNSEPAWMHLGGMQIIDDVLILAVENSWPTGCNCGALLFYDIRQPQEPVLINTIPTAGFPGFGGTLGVFGITKDPLTGRYFFVVTAGDSRRLRFYETTATDLFDPDLGISSLQGTEIDSWDVDGIIGDPSVLDSWQSWQTLNFVRQDDGRLFLIGMQRTTPLVGTNYIHLYEIIKLGDQIELFNRGGKELQRAELSAGGGVYVSPSGELILYSTLLNEGFSDNLTGGTGDAEILIHEWRSNFVRYQSEPRSEYWVEIIQDNRKYLLESEDFNNENWENLQSELISDGSHPQLPSAAIYNMPIGRSMLFYPFANYTGPPMMLNGVGIPSGVILENFASYNMSIFAGRMQIPNGAIATPFINELQRLADLPGYQGPLEAQFFGITATISDPITAGNREILLLPSPGTSTLLTPSP